ncbi:hypothetical protein VDQ16_05495 [Xanthomonas campestris pv. campestris]|nr:hypothetical protein [Xanthomonas campestris]MEB1262168.1 hypothetical protein [Xanthomonas campestris pv. campestris]MEB1322550.1 hypothetical protein [Xanthomonas campestris pv. campestris]MEB1356825.1 hypothetical protein [Xanthomonas campestris pv. campestris]MEB1423011.1 hypothetical protein [Xanthomonas campestris pv. campestris]
MANSRLMLRGCQLCACIAVMLFCLANSKQQTANSKQQTANSKQQTANSKQQTARGGGASAHPLRNAAANHVAAPNSSNRDLVVIKIHAHKPAIRSFSL